MLVKILVDASTKDMVYFNYNERSDKMKYKRYIFPVLMGFTMSNIMLLANTGKIIFPAILIMMILQAVVASVASLVFPAGLIGAKMTKKLFPRLNSIGFLLVSSILPAIFLHQSCP
jgi:small-conductance mechanosensitive channel